MKIFERIPFVKEVQKLGGEVYLVGGYVRDYYLYELFGFTTRSKDVDILITGIEKEKLLQVLKSYGRVDDVGASFGIFKFKSSDIELDVALPRTEIKTGEGHRGFKIVADHKITIEEDLKRRDFTMNAIAIRSDGFLVDPYNGIKDIEENLIRAVSLETFRDDPLRILRAYQFCSRFAMFIEDQTMKEILEHKKSLREITGERISEEIRKLVKPNSQNVVKIINKMQRDGIIDELIITSPDVDRSHYQYVGSIAEFLFYVCDKPMIEYVTERFKLSKEEVLELTAITNVERRPVPFLVYQQGQKWSKIFDTDFFNDHSAIQNVLDKFKTLPRSLKEIEVTTKELVALGIIGKDLGKMYKVIEHAVINKTIENDNSQIISYVKDYLTRYS